MAATVQVSNALTADQSTAAAGVFSSMSAAEGQAGLHTLLNLETFAWQKRPGYQQPECPAYLSPSVWPGSTLGQSPIGELMI